MIQKKTTYKRILALILAFIMFVSCLTGIGGGGALAYEGSSQSTEVPTGEESANEIPTAQDASSEEPRTPDPGSDSSDIQESLVDIQFTVYWMDEADLAGLRPQSPTELFEIFADGEQIYPQIERITQELKTNEDSSSVIHKEQYQILMLPKYREDGITAITYTVKENQDLNYYTQINKTEDADFYAAPEETVTITEQLDGSWQGDKAFGNMLPFYAVNGQIKWDELPIGIRMEDWFEHSGNQYYADENGTLITGWFQYDNQWYYFTEDGICLKNTTTPDGYYVDENGIWTP